MSKINKRVDTPEVRQTGDVEKRPWSAPVLKGLPIAETKQGLTSEAEALFAINAS